MIDLDRHMQGNAFIANDFLSQKKKNQKNANDFCNRKIKRHLCCKSLLPDI